SKFVIDEAHCILAYQDFRKAWTQLGILKQQWKSAPIMLLTAICTRSEVDEILTNLTIKNDKFTLSSIRNNFNVNERKEIHNQYITNIVDIIKRYLPGRFIIYCATHSNCERLYNKLQENLTNISVGYFHGGLRDDERETIMNNWKYNHIQVMVATSAFGMGINSNDIRAVIHAEVPMSMTNLIQEAGRAGCDGNTAIHVIFFSKKDIRTNYSIIAEYRDTEQNLTNKLERAASKIFEVFYYCISQYECRQQLIWKYQAWPDEEKPSVCERCDNCIK
ncbi:P-loop containing nucleoside triphosphate hydrolase protein, partial [Rhizophagus irregularis]